MVSAFVVKTSIHSCTEMRFASRLFCK